ncbi:GNAT family N-acetyltransferase [Dactylosporangium sp. CS-047395]|uniref:GNAT family N-acetyltransferase n=1 Tax=Dactylosporangium sp. CS-047395 TaxID=3239936 RepID=UPI003D944985
MRPTELPGGAVLRPLELADVPALLEAKLRTRHLMLRAVPDRPASFWTVEGQRDWVEQELRRDAAEESLTCVIARGPAVLGMLGLSGIVRGPFRNATISYWLDPAEHGKGLASTAVAVICAAADAELDLHRIEAGTMADNVASQRVLLRNGFEQLGRARDYVYSEGAWRDVLLFQRILHDRPLQTGHA